MTAARAQRSIAARHRQWQLRRRVARRWHIALAMLSIPSVVMLLLHAVTADEDWFIATFVWVGVVGVVSLGMPWPSWVGDEPPKPRKGES